MATSDVVLNIKTNVQDAVKNVDGFVRGINDKLIGVVKSYGAVAAAAVATGAAIKEAFEFVESIANIADETNKINQQFDQLASNAGASAIELRAAFADTNQGIVDLEDVLKSASVAIANLNLPAQDIAKNFEAARKVSIGFGVDTNEAFQKINNAIASGNTKSLKQIGIFIDSKQAVDDYAKSLGIAAKFLTDAQKEAAIFNAIQNKINSTFQNVDLNTKTTSESFLQFKTAAGDVSEAVAIGLNKMFGPAIQTLLGKFSGVLSSLANQILKQVGSETEKAAAKQELFNEKLQSEIETLNELKKIQEQTNGRSLSGINSRVQRQEALVNKLREEQEAVDTLALKRAAAEKAVNDIQKASKSPTSEEIAKQQELLRARQEFSAKAIAAQSALTDAVLKGSTDRQTILDFEAKKEVELKAQATQKKLEIDKSAEGLGVAARAEANAAKVAIEQATLLQIEQLKAESNQRLLESEILNETLRGNISVEGGLKRTLLEKQIVDAQIAEAKRGSEEEKKLKLKSAQLENEIGKQKVAAATTALGNLATLQQTNSKELFAIGKAAAIADATIRGFQAYNLALATLPPPFGAIVGATSLVAAGVQVSKIAATNLATGITEVPSGFPNDTFKANLTSGERVLSVNQNKDLTDFLAKSESGAIVSGDGAVGLLERIAQRLDQLENTIVVNIGNKEIVREVREGLRAGRTLTA